MNEAIQMSGVRKSYGSVRAVDGFDLTIEAGRVVGFLGLNGAGKTTTMRLLTGFIRAEAGTLQVLGHDPWTMGPEVRRRIGYLSEKDFPFPTMTFSKAAAFTSKFLPAWDNEYVARLQDLLKIPAGPYSVMSRGQQRKFQLALTLAPKPELILLDDPAQGLDVTVRRDFIQSILPLLHDQRSTVLFSSHIMSDVERIADSIVIMKAGKLLLQRSLDEIKESAKQVIVTGGPSVRPPRGTLRAQKSATEECFTVLDADPSELDSLRNGGNVTVRPVGLEDFFCDVMEGGMNHDPH